MRNLLNRLYDFSLAAPLAVLLAFTVASAPAANAASPDGFEDLAQNLLPTVVNVSTTAKAPQMARKDLPPLPELPPGSPFEDFFKDFYDQYKNNQPPADEKVSALGSGFVVDATNGYIVTNNHVIKDADEIKVILHDNTTLEATLVGTDEKTDIAVLKVKPAKPLVAVQWGDSDQAKVGSWILAIGNPFGLGGTVTAGIVSARQRDINAGPYDDFIQTDASINRGNSGGPMFNMRGEVVGVNTAIFSPSGGSVGIGFAIPSNIAKGVVEQLVKYGKTKRGWLGVRIQEVTPEIADSLGLDRAKGALVSSLTEKSPAEAAGVKPGDVILTFDGREVDSVHKLPRMVAESEVGKTATLTLWRKGETKTVTVNLGQLETAEESGILKTGAKEEDKAPDGPATDLESLGLSLGVLTDKARATYGLPKALRGVLITAVKKGGRAAEKGLSPGDVIAEVDQADVATPADVIQKVEAAEKAGHSTVLFFVGRKEDMRFVALKLKGK
ncbi:MAG: DegQ family serine endoprotease [Alphaproteobacteria bacterium]|nr:MAG: DegQ family serine endoprotease [Alphaproteobacteria bacterium]